MISLYLKLRLEHFKALDAFINFTKQAFIENIYNKKKNCP